MKMQNGFKDLALFDLDGESKLYVVDSINNLHRTNTCEDPCDPLSNSAECDSVAEETEASTKELLKDNGKKEPEADLATIKSTENGPPCCFWQLKKKLLFAAVIVLLLVSFVLAALAIFFIVRMENQLSYISTRVAAEEKNIKEIKLLMMDHFNFSKESNSDVSGISPTYNTQSP
ncbi:leucine-rich single-pass membrane protein 1-like [Heptranchias perlo]|uniref:leucine-rich single-pass membrane protein 1-like n=1 Tax=Heptranchias perlo TaxID=212740 RepID=UPI003559FFA0